MAALTGFLAQGCVSRGPNIKPAAWDEVSSIESGGIRRTFIIHPPRLTEAHERLPVIFILHGGGGTAHGMLNLTLGRFQELGETRRFIAVYPDGVEKVWNDGRLGILGAKREKIDDTAFLRSLMEYVAARYPADPRRVYVTGISNGALMSYRLACEIPGMIQGIAAVTGSLSGDLEPHCHPTIPVSVLIMNGTNDPLVPYNGGEIKVLLRKRRIVHSTEDTLRFWAAKAGCEKDPVVQSLPDSDPADGTTVKTTSFTRCMSGRRVMLYTVEGGGHTWPRGWQYLPESFVGKTSRELSASDAIVDFFLGPP